VRLHGVLDLAHATPLLSLNVDSPVGTPSPERSSS
jgi:hypothetical protein